MKTKKVLSIAFENLREPLSTKPAFAPEWTVAAFVFAILVCILFGLYLLEKLLRNLL